MRLSDNPRLAVCSAGDKYRVDAKQDTFREAGKRAGNTVGAAFDEGALGSGSLSEGTF
jgi:hypothetical protein